MRIGFFKNRLESSKYTKNYFSDKRYIIGEFTYGHPQVSYHFDKSTNLIIGKFCSIADNVKILMGANHRIDWVTTYPFPALNQTFPAASKIAGHPATKGNVVIGNDVWISHGVIILSGVTIENGAVIAAGSVVTKNIGPYEIWGGNPARFIKKRFSDGQISKLQQIRWWDFPVDKIKAIVNDLCCTDIDTFIEKYSRAV